MNKTTPDSGTRCSQGTCVDMKRNADGTVTYWSTIGGPGTSVTFTGQEHADFLEQVKANKWDHI
jgi:hypothetical protein